MGEQNGEGMTFEWTVSLGEIISIGLVCLCILIGLCNTPDKVETPYTPVNMRPMYTHDTGTAYHTAPPVYEPSKFDWETSAPKKRKKVAKRKRAKR